jgi:hypothetical protein
MFEPTRTSAACLAEAYARLVPARRRAVRSAQAQLGVPAATPLQRTGGTR